MCLVPPRSSRVIQCILFKISFFCLSLQSDSSLHYFFMHLPWSEVERFQAYLFSTSTSPQGIQYFWSFIIIVITRYSVCYSLSKQPKAYLLGYKSHIHQYWVVRSGLYTPETPNPPLPIGLVEDFTFKHPYLPNQDWLPNQVTEQHLCTQTTSYPLSACLDQKTQVEHTFYATMYLQIIEQHEQLLAAGWAWGSDQLEASSDVAHQEKPFGP